MGAMILTQGQRVRLDERDEYTHPVEAAHNFNESVYINVFDHQQEMGGWFRVGNRPNEGRAEVSCCVYLPDGQVGFMFQRPEIANNDRFAAGGMTFEVIRPFRELRVSYVGSLLLLQEPAQMENPKKAFESNPIIPCEVDIRFTSDATVHGGEAVDEDGNPLQERPGESFARAHYEQHVSGSGTIQVGDEAYSVCGLGLRDHSWGPRYWQNLHWYRWLPFAFTEAFGMSLTVIGMADGGQRTWGFVTEDDESHAVEQIQISTSYDANYHPSGYQLEVRTNDKRYEIEAQVLSLIPLRNRRKRDDESWMQTRILEGFTRFRCNGAVGYGMSEFLDQIVDGLPVGRAV